MAVLPEALRLYAASLVVIAPHPDDDVLGCGALIARVASRMPVRVVYVTDGAASHGGSAEYPPLRVREVREREAARALRRLRVTAPPQFLRWPDGTVPYPTERRARPLVDAIRATIPHDDDVAVAMPWRRDPHCDHRAVASLVVEALRERPRAMPFEYTVWLGVIGEEGDAPGTHEGELVEVPAGPWLRAKRNALQQHRSQLGRLITDADTAFELPPELLARALGPTERFVIPAHA